MILYASISMYSFWHHHGQPVDVLHSIWAKHLVEHLFTVVPDCAIQKQVDDRGKAMYMEPLISND
jgi:hypothetical protein